MLTDGFLFDFVLAFCRKKMVAAKQKIRLLKNALIAEKKRNALFSKKLKQVNTNSEVCSELSLFDDQQEMELRHSTMQENKSRLDDITEHYRLQ